MLNFLKYLLVLLSILPLTSMTFTITDEYLMGINLLGVTIFIFTRLKLDKFIIYLIASFLIINVMAFFFFGSFNLFVIIGFILRLLFPYWVVKIVGKDLLDIVPKIGFFSAVLSLPFYLIQLINYRLLLNIFSYYPLITTDLRLSVGKYSLFFHTIDINILERNNGFLWEPGGFGYFLGISLIILLYKSNLKFNFQSIIILLIGLTTLSTTYYIFIILIFILYFLNNVNKNLGFLILLPIFIGIIFVMLSQEFMFQKIENHILDTQEVTSAVGYSKNYDKIGRLANFQVEMLDFLSYPIGFGVQEKGRTMTSYGDFVSGPCGLSHHIARWGIWGIIILIISLQKFSKYLNHNFNSQIKLFSTLGILFFLFSNPIDRDLFLFSLLYLPFVKSWYL